MTNHFDAAIIGFGHQGLIAANLLKLAGLKVAALDIKSPVAGGMAYDFFADGYRTGPCAHAPVPVDQALAAELGLEERGFLMRPEQTCSFAPASLNSGEYLFSTASRNATRREIAKLSENDANIFMQFSDDVHNLAQILEQVAGTLPPYTASGWKDLWGVFETGRLLSEGGETAQNTFANLMKESLYEAVGRMFENDQVRAFLTAQATMASMTVPSRKGSASALIQYMLGLGGHRPYRGDWQPLRGGIHHYLRALSQAALDNGVDFFPGQVAERFELQNNRISGIALSDGEVITADKIITDINPLILAERFIGTQNIPTDLQNHLKPLTQGTGFVRLKLSLTGLPRFTSLTGASDSAFTSGEIIIAPDMDYIKTAHHDSHDEGGATRPVISLVIPTLSSDELAPQGHHTASIIAQYYEPNLPNDADNWGAIASSVYSAIETVSPGFSKLVDTAAVYMGDNLARTIGPINRESLGGGHPLTQLFGGLFGHHALGASFPYENLVICGYGPESSASPHINRGGQNAAHFVMQAA